jgi:hypothetical protein
METGCEALAERPDAELSGQEQRCWHAGGAGSAKWRLAVRP